MGDAATAAGPAAIAALNISSFSPIRYEKKRCVVGAHDVRAVAVHDQPDCVHPLRAGGDLGVEHAG